MLDLKTLAVCRRVTSQLFETLAARAQQMGFMHAVEAAGTQCRQPITNN